ncbi:uncharacterized protein [Dysidea avara]|uniref:uncharacterized protein isoform X2 n=1 Tax=Dysidea avara TaxID=196820 RepID=UPI00331E6908
MEPTIQVAWLGSDEKITWESRSSLPQHLIDDFENGMQYEEAVITEAKFGAVNHTVTINMTTTTPEQPSKKSRTSLPDYTPGGEIANSGNETGKLKLKLLQNS